MKIEDTKSSAMIISDPKVAFVIRPGMKTSYREKFGNKENSAKNCENLTPNICRYCNVEIPFYV